MKNSRFSLMTVLALGALFTAVALSALGLASCGPVSNDECNGNANCPTGMWCDDGTCVNIPDPDAGDPHDVSTPQDGGTEDALMVCQEQTFPLSQTEEYFVVPANAVWMHVKAWGAGGNQTGLCSPTQDGGMGGYSEAAFEVGMGTELPTGTELTVIVGYPGSASSSRSEVFRFGFGSTGGGGLSGVFRDWGEILETDQSRALIIAGGGGSAAEYVCSAGGTGNHTDPSVAGGEATMMGGLGQGDENFNGGGGGYYGGSGGVGDGNSKGGTGFVDTVLARSDYLILASEPGTEVPPKTDDPDYVAADNVGYNECRGHIVIRILCGPPDPIVL